MITKEKHKMDFFKFSEEEILENDKIKIYLVEDRIDIYNDIARVMAEKIKENNTKGNITSFILPVGPKGQYKRFARICNLERISCKNLITINMDEKTISKDEFRNLKTRILELDRDTILISSIKYGGYFEYIPKRCITLGMAEIFMAKELRFYLEHNWQSTVLRKAIFLDSTPSFPISFLKEYTNSSIIISNDV